MKSNVQCVCLQGIYDLTVKIKICGLTNLSDAQAALAAGADFLGFVFVRQSPRRAAPETVREIVALLPRDTRTVGVFADQSAAEIRDIVDSCGLHIVQLHSNETVPLIRALADCGEIWKAVWPQAPQDLPALTEIPADALVVDSATSQRRGGTGIVGDWSLAAQLARRRRTVLAGGLNPDNIVAAVEAVRPFAVDVASGVESNPGIKDHEKIRAFCAALK